MRFTITQEAAIGMTDALEVQRIIDGQAQWEEYCERNGLDIVAETRAMTEAIEMGLVEDYWVGL